MYPLHLSVRFEKGASDSLGSMSYKVSSLEAIALSDSLPRTVWEKGTGLCRSSSSRACGLLCRMQTRARGFSGHADESARVTAETAMGHE